MGSIVRGSVYEAEPPAIKSFAGYEEYQRDQQPHDFHYHHWGYRPAYPPRAQILDVLNHGGGMPGSTQNFAHKKHSIFEVASWTPDTDVRESKFAYHIEMELAGVKNKKDILIQWMSPRTLLVEGKAVRPRLTRGHETDGEAVWPSDEVSKSTDVEKGVPKSEKEKDGESCVKCADAAEDMSIKMIHGERKIGSWRRYFTLPMEVDMKTLKAGFEDGLLHISATKLDKNSEGVVKVVVD